MTRIQLYRAMVVAATGLVIQLGRRFARSQGGGGYQWQVMTAEACQWQVMTARCEECNERLLCADERLLLEWSPCRILLDNSDL